MAVAVAAAEAVELVAGFLPKLKWPNDLVWPGDGTADDRKLAGVLAEADWGAAVAVVVGIGLNVRWPRDLPPELADVAIAINHISDVDVDREQLLIALLQRLDRWYGAPDLRDRWRELSATIGRSVRVELADEQVTGIAVDVDDAGHLIVEQADGARRSFAVGDVVHLRPT
jgi:BirA family biotin operon repressor/biotin-[acetyl-CoA-carboxylase] ligase